MQTEHTMIWHTANIAAHCAVCVCVDNERRTILPEVLNWSKWTDHIVVSRSPSASRTAYGFTRVLNCEYGASATPLPEQFSFLDLEQKNRWRLLLYHLMNMLILFEHVHELRVWRFTCRLYHNESVVIYARGCWRVRCGCVKHVCEYHRTKFRLSLIIIIFVHIFIFLLPIDFLHRSFVKRVGIYALSDQNVENSAESGKGMCVLGKSSTKWI